MRKYTVEGAPAVIGPDMLMGLSRDQAKVRAHRLIQEGAHWRPTRTVTFKAGEVISLDREPDDLPATLGEVLVPARSEVTVAKSRASTKRRGAKSRASTKSKPTPEPAGTSPGPVQTGGVAAPGPTKG
ncbi:hypothetical protein [Oceaniradius stylonematis]|uniref:hypothetical protein n=1 Tax=Oceaniradius stylonematis TaxID=2184161 RepID=UPI003B593890